MKYRIWAVLILLCAVGVGFFVYTTQKPDSRFNFKLGLDLSGGTQLTYHADVSQVDKSQESDAMSSLRDIIERRVNLFGVSEPIVQTEKGSALAGASEQRLIVELPGVTNIEQAISLIGQTPLLEFKLRTGDVSQLQGKTPEELKKIDINQFYTPTGLTGRLLKKASLQFGNGQATGVSNEATVVLEFNKEGSDLFAKITRENTGKYLAIFLDGQPISEPVIREEIPNGTAVISGNFTPTEARDLVKNLNFGALPVPITLIGTQGISASLGDTLFKASVMAGIWGFILISLFMILWYRLPGVVSVIALSVYAALMLALFKLVPVTLTAAGIAGFILSIGMAVDANVLIFERIKDELRHRTEDLDLGIREGFSRAWLSIRDSNTSTLITGLILFWFGTSIIQGFALTLVFGIVTSMITAIVVTRIFLLAIKPRSLGSLTRFLWGSGFHNVMLEQDSASK